MPSQSKAIQYYQVTTEEHTFQCHLSPELENGYDITDLFSFILSHLS